MTEEKIKSILSGYDVCLASTDEQLEKCKKECTGHGCPLWNQAAAEIMKLMQGENSALQNRVKELEGELERVKPLTESLRADIAKLPIEANYFGAVDRIKLAVVRLERIGWTSRTATENDLEMLTPPATNNL